MQFTTPTNKVDTILEALNEQILDSQCSLLNPEFVCSERYPQSVIIRAEISDQGMINHTCDCNMALQFLSAWINDGASILVEANRLNINSNCNIRVTTNNDEFICERNNSNNMPTNPSIVEGDDSSRFTVIGASSAVVFIMLALFTVIIVGVLYSKTKKKKAR